MTNRSAFLISYSKWLFIGYILSFLLEDVDGSPCICRLSNNNRVCVWLNHTNCDPYLSPELKLDLSHSSDSAIILIESFSKGSFYPKSLDLSHCHISQIDVNLLTRFDNVVAIHLSFNQLIYFDNVNNSLKKFKKLDILNLNHNNITEVDFENFTNQKYLKVLNLSYNRVKKFLGYFFVKSLNLQYNNLSNVDGNFFENFKFLNQLDLQYNDLCEIDDNLFSNLIDLEDLKISHNNLKNLNSKTFEYSLNLKNLELQFNNLAIIQIGYFEYLINLERLNISYNKVHFVSKLCFRHLFKLKQLDLSHNFLYSFQQHTFGYLFNLEFLAINHNKFEFLNLDDIFQNSNSFSLLHINDNHLNFYNFLNIIKKCRLREVVTQPKLYNRDHAEMTIEEIDLEKEAYILVRVLAFVIVALIGIIFNVYMCQFFVKKRREGWEI